MLRVCISLFLAFLVLVAIVCVGGALVLRYAALDESSLTARLGAQGLADAAYGRLAEAFDGYQAAAGGAGGLENEGQGAFYAGALTRERTLLDIEAEIRKAFGEGEGADIAGFRAKLNEGLRSGVEAQGLVLTKERTEAFEYLSELCAQAYEKAVAVPEAMRLAELAKRADALALPFTIGGGALLAATVAFLFALHGRKWKKALPYIAYGAAGAALFAAFLYINS